MQWLTSDESGCLLDGVPELAFRHLSTRYTINIGKIQWVFKERKHMQSFSGIWNRFFQSIKSLFLLTLRGLWPLSYCFSTRYFFLKYFVNRSKTNKQGKQKKVKMVHNIYWPIFSFTHYFQILNIFRWSILPVT